MSSTPEDPSNAPVYGPTDGFGSDPELPKTDDTTALEKHYPEPVAPPTSTPPGTAVTDRTRAATTWVGLVIGAIVLILLLVFILQNLESVSVKILAWQIDFPLGITILLSAIAGALIMALAGGIRIVQIRRAAKRQL
ncbi:lipopolysaccharide assembly LapA domain-containing protein [Rhodococcus sp. ARC_M6]|uniref:LapA family protein n=1 Tax=Rhodococcus sp. ARC_M6 TaxID=2928852 RepID=UPI001FB3B296|nr:lipopolysaccharide assembly protein LapA domain-containing protein [Rhodococcus sp. ARC_M6]MCJ0904811.1 lipopolysaccharide assembly protein LapA domain-containing protein [Rhodococcus sp. ARC_M6]